MKVTIASEHTELFALAKKICRTKYAFPIAECYVDFPCIWLLFQRTRNVHFIEVHMAEPNALGRLQLRAAFECEQPTHYNCPLAFLQRANNLDDLSWRSKVLTWHQTRTKPLTVGSRVQVNHVKGQFEGVVASLGEFGQVSVKTSSKAYPTLHLAYEARNSINLVIAGKWVCGGDGKPFY